LNDTKPIMTKFYTMNEPLWVVSRLPRTKPIWQTADILNFVKC